MKKIAKFEKVSFEQFKKDWISTFDGNPIILTDDATIRDAYKTIKLPERGTRNSAGYDICSTVDFHIGSEQEIKIPTGIRCKMNPEYFLMILPRSGLGFKYYTRLANTAGIVDADYYCADNEGHIFVKIRNESDKGLNVKRGDAVCQGIFLEFGITDDDNASAERHGGFGSTGK